MPRLIELDPASVVATPNATPNAYGADVGAARNAQGDAFGSLGKVMAEYASSKSRAAAMQFKQELSQRVAEINANPNIEERQKQFEDAQRETFQKYRPSWSNGMPHEYDSEAGFAGEAARIGMIDQARTDALNETRRNDGLELSQHAADFANAKTDADAELSLASMHALIERRVAGGVYSQGQATIVTQSALHDGLALAAETDPDRAATYLERFKGILSADQQAGLRSKIGTEKTELEAQALSDTFFDIHGPNATEDQMLKWIRANAPAGKARSAAEQRISSVIALHNRAENERQVDLENSFASQVGDALAATTDPSAYPALRNDYRKRMEGAGLDHGRIESVLQDLDNAARGVKVVTDPVYFDDVMTHPDKLGQPGYTDAELARKLAPEQLGQVLKLKRDVEQGSLPNQAAITSRISSALDTEGFSKTDKRRGLFRSQIQGQIDAMKRPPTGAEIDSIAASVIQAASKAGTFKFRPDVAQDDLIEEAQTKDPALYRFAVWNASRGGTIVATPTQIASQVAVQQRELDQLRKTMTKEKYDRLVSQMQKEGNNAAALLSGQGYENADEVLLIDDAFRRDYLTKPEGSW